MRTKYLICTILLCLPSQTGAIIRDYGNMVIIQWDSPPINRNLSWSKTPAWNSPTPAIYY